MSFKVKRGLELLFSSGSRKDGVKFVESLLDDKSREEDSREVLVICINSVSSSNWDERLGAAFALAEYLRKNVIVPIEIEKSMLGVESKYLKSPFDFKTLLESPDPCYLKHKLRGNKRPFSNSTQDAIDLKDDKLTLTRKVLVKLLVNSLLADDWVVRHGAAVALVESVISLHDFLCGNNLYDNLINSCLLLLGKDYFMDYLGSIVFYPVRQPVAKLMARILVQISAENSNDSLIVKDIVSKLRLLWSSTDLKSSRKHIFLLVLQYIVDESKEVFYKFFIDDVATIENHIFRQDQQESEDLLRAYCRVALTASLPLSQYKTKILVISNYFAILDENETLTVSIDMLKFYKVLCQGTTVVPDVEQIISILVGAENTTVRKHGLEMLSLTALSEDDLELLLEHFLDEKNEELLPIFLTNFGNNSTKDFILTVCSDFNTGSMEIINPRIAMLLSRVLTSTSVQALSTISEALRKQFKDHKAEFNILLIFVLFVYNPVNISQEQHKTAMDYCFSMLKSESNLKLDLCYELFKIVSELFSEDVSSLKKKLSKLLKFAFNESVADIHLKVILWLYFCVFQRIQKQEDTLNTFLNICNKFIQHPQDKNLTFYLFRCVLAFQRTNYQNEWFSFLQRQVLGSSPYLDTEVVSYFTNCFVAHQLIIKKSNYSQACSVTRTMKILSSPENIVQVFCIAFALTISFVHFGTDCLHLEALIIDIMTVQSLEASSIAEVFSILLFCIKNPSIIDGEIHTVLKANTLSVCLRILDNFTNHIKSDLFIVFFVPLMKMLQESINDVKVLSSKCFYKILNITKSNFLFQSGTGADLLKNEIAEANFFVDSLLRGNFVFDQPLPFPKIKLRDYQVEAIAWLSFLNKYSMNGMLCDDLGLGKTLMSLYTIANLLTTRETEAFSIVICPATLMDQWVEECQKWFNKRNSADVFFISTMNKVDKNVLKNLKDIARNSKKHLIVVLSLRQVNSVGALLKSAKIFYCVVDEAHRIRNRTTKTNSVIRSIIAPISQHKLLLTGTPFRSNAMDVFAYFEILLPFYFGTKTDFQATYSKHVNAYRKDFHEFFSMQQLDADEKVGEFEVLKYLEDAKNLENQDMDQLQIYADQEYQNKKQQKRREKMARAQKAVTELKLKLLPFIMRRLKSEVLSELPPKITKVIEVELTPFQMNLYKKLTTKESINDHVSTTIFDLLNICNHPEVFAKTKKYQQFSETGAIVKSILTQDQSKISAKFAILKSLLEDVIDENKAIIFVQQRVLAESIAVHVLNKLPFGYVKLDGSIAPEKRGSIVNTFKTNKNRQILLSTTRIGGVGLNLSIADTVILVEHSFDPFVDLQAIDRTHRLGQKNAVNVFKIVTKGTIEEELLKTQLFKQSINSELFAQESDEIKKFRQEAMFQLVHSMSQDIVEEQQSHEPIKKSKIEQAVAELQELWTEDQYGDN